MAEQVHRDFLEANVLSRLAGLPLNARHPMLGNVTGRHRSPVRGSSLEFAEYRKYVPGDDLRRMDWRAWGRSDRYYIKETEADTNLRMCLILDTSGSMRFGKTGQTKLDYARRIAGTLAYLAARQGDAVGLYGVNNKLHTEIPAKRGSAHLKVVLDSMAALNASEGTSLDTVLHEAAEKIPRRGLILIFSDLFMETNTLSDCFQHLRFRKHDVGVFHLLSPQEVKLEPSRPIRFVDLEGGPAILADPATLAAQYQQAVDTYLEELRVIMRDAAVDYHRVNVEDPYADVLARFLLRRAK